MPRVVHFEIHADDPERAAKFYTDIFGWEIKKAEGSEDYWNVLTGLDGSGIDGWMAKRRTVVGGESIVAFVCVTQVKSIDETVARVKKAGGLLVIEKVSVPGIGIVAYCKDTERNVFGIMEAPTTTAAPAAASIENTHE